MNSNNGAVAWNTTGTIIGSLWAAQVVIESYQSGAFRTKVGVDFLIKIAPPGNPPVINPNPDPAHPPVCSTTQPAQVGKAITFTVTASDPDPLDLVTLNVAGLPGTAAMNPTLPVGPANSVSSTFSWTPTTADIDKHVVNFFATDNRGSQAQCPVTIDVVKANVIHPIVFVPGLMGSKLADGNGVEVWPTGVDTSADDNFRRLVLPNDDIGATVLMDEAQANVDIYKTWMKRLDDEWTRGLKWQGVPYDWRYHPGQTAYIQESLSSVLIRRTNKVLSQLIIDAVNKKYDETGLSVLIVSHSMGNFLVKEALRQEPGLADRVFGVVFVAAPQAGSAAFLENVLHGEGDALSTLLTWTGIAQKDVRQATLSMPGVYMNGPTRKYFEFVQSVLSGVPAPLQFGDGNQVCTRNVVSPDFVKLCNRYGGAIRTYDDYVDFLLNPSSRFGFLATEAELAAGENLEEPSLLKDDKDILISKDDIFRSVEGIHGAIDDPNEWNPTGLKIYQIVGTNEETDCGIPYYEVSLYLGTGAAPPTILRRQEQIACPGKGDGTVISQSAEITPSRITVYLDLAGCPEQDSFLLLDRKHANIMESESVFAFRLKYNSVLIID